MNKIYYCIYEVTNLINGKTYIGQHITENLNDGYIGSGTSIKHAVRKYGKKNFKKEILLLASNRAALNFMEKCLVTEEFVNDRSNYNLKTGGDSNAVYSQESRNRMSASAMGKRTGNENPAFKEVNTELLKICQEKWILFGQNHLIQFLKGEYDIGACVVRRLIKTFREDSVLNHERKIRFKDSQKALMVENGNILHRRGKDNNRYSHTLLDLLNTKTDEKFCGTRNQFFNNFGFQLHGEFLNRRRITCKGWRFNS